jgi:hypothetical protein
MGEYYNTQQRIPRRRSATPDAVAQRQTQTGSALHMRTRHTDEDDASSSSPMKPLARRFDRAPLTATFLTRQYVIPLTDGTEMHVTERELADLPENYQNAAHLITPQEAAHRHKRPPNPKRPVQDETVDDMPPAKTHARGTDALPRQHRRRLPRFHWLVWVGLTMCSMLVGWYALTALGNWWQTMQNDWQYGRPRTFQIDANVGHGTASHPDSHFIALNLDRKIIVIEIPGDDPTHARIYIGPTLIGPGEDLTPVTLSFEDVNGDGRLDFVIHVGDSTFIFLNQKDGTFKAAPNQ